MLTKQAVEYIKLGSGGSYSLSRDAIKHRLWDTRQFGATATDFVFFQQPNGATWTVGTNKSTNETNIFDSGKLPNGQTFLISRFSVGLIVPIAAASTAAAQYCRAFNNILQSSYFEIIIQGRAFDFQIHGSEMLPRPISIYGVEDNDTNGSFGVRVGDMLASGWAKLDPAPIFVDTLVSFQVNHRLNNPIAAVKTLLDADATLLDGVYGSMICTLEGFLTRAK
jgi:hypothetical protein